MLTNTFTIGTMGSLKLPIIGDVPAAGLRTDEVAKLITDRLQARRGLRERPVTTVQLKQTPSLAVRGSVERPGKYRYRPNLTVREAIEAAGGLAQIAETGTQLNLSISRGVGRVRELTVEGNSLVLPGDIIWVGRRPALVARTARSFADRPSAGDANHTNTEERQHAASPGPAGSRAEQQQALERERSKADALLRDPSVARREVEAVRREALAARREIDALKKRQQTAGEEREHALRRELMAAREELDRMRGDAAAQARAGAYTTALQARALEEQRQRAERLARNLSVASQSINALKANANLTAAAQAAASQGRQVAEAALKRIGEQLALERKRADSVARELDSARQQRDAAMQEVTRVSAELRAALDEERDKAIGLARDVRAARNEIEMLKVQEQRRTARIEPAPKPRATTSPGVSKWAGARPAYQSGSQEIRKVENRKPSRPVRLTTIALPDALLPTR